MLASAVRRGVDVIGRPLDSIAARRCGQGRVVILIYHRVGARTPSPVDLPSASFASQLDLLAASDRVVDIDTAWEVLGGDVSASVDEPVVVLSFDDGTADWVDVALPLLVERGLPAVFYVATDFVDRARPFPDHGTPISWAGLAELADSGLATIGSHTHTHRVLAGVDAGTASAEIERSAERIEDGLGRPCRHFAYPRAIAPSPAAETVVRRRFATAALAGNRANDIGSSDLHRLGRHALTRDDGPSSFRRKVAGGARLEGVLRSVRDSW
jgi:peptidoglycan/xylan/chitin deacetylase (PgdA/CDA1 family)